MQKNQLLFVIPIVIVVIILLLVTRKKCKECETCPKDPTCPTCPTDPTCPTCPTCPISPTCPNPLESLLSTVPSGVQDLSIGSKSMGVPNISTYFTPCTNITNALDINAKKSIALGTYGQLLKNTGSTNTNYPYVYRPYSAPPVAASIDPLYVSKGVVINGGICDYIKDKVVYGKNIECNSNTAGTGVTCPTGKNCLLSSDDNNNNVCV